MILRWIGLGWLSPTLTLGSFLASMYVGLILTREGSAFAGLLLTGKSGAFAGLLVGSGLVALLAPLHWLLGLVLNSEMKPSGRIWHNRHTTFGNPIQFGFVPQLMLALTTGCANLPERRLPCFS